jgi:hypothetical protein
VLLEEDVDSSEDVSALLFFFLVILEKLSVQKIMMYSTGYHEMMPSNRERGKRERVDFEPYRRTDGLARPRLS